MNLREWEMRLNQKEKKGEQEKKHCASIFSLFVWDYKSLTRWFYSWGFILVCCCCLQWRFVVTVHRDSNFVVIGEFWGDSAGDWWVYSGFHLSMRGIYEGMIKSSGGNLWWQWWCQLSSSNFWWQFGPSTSATQQNLRWWIGPLMSHRLWLIGRLG